MRAIAILLLVAGLAGCLTENSTGPEDNACAPGPFDHDTTRLVDPSHDPIADIVETGDLQDFDVRDVRTCSLPAVGWTPLRTNDDGTPAPHKYLGELDMRGDLNLGAVAVLGNSEDAHVYLVNITDRANPSVVSRIDQSGVYLVDVKFSDDGKILYTASQALANNVEIPELTAPTGRLGFTAYNIEDPANPTYMGTVQDPGIGCHMIDPVQVSAGQDAVFCVSEHVRAYLVDRSTPVLVNMGFVDMIPSGPQGAPQPALPIGGGPAGTTSSGPHDMTAYHEGGAFGEGRSYMVISHWNSGVRVFDFTDAPLATEVGSWNGEGATHYDGNVHTAMMFDTAEGRYILASPEMTYGGVVPSMWLLDANDFSNIHLVGEWFHPGEYTSDLDGLGGGLLATTHQWQVAPVGADVSITETNLYLTFNHAGVWVLDVDQFMTGDNQAAILGYNLARNPVDYSNAVGNAVLSTWDVGVVDGYIYGTDRATGLWVFQYEGDTPGDERLRGFA